MILLSREEVGRELGIGPSTVLRWVTTGVMPAPIQLDGYCRWPKPTIEEWAARGCLPCTPPDGKTNKQIRKLILLEIQEDESKAQLIKSLNEA